MTSNTSPVLCEDGQFNWEYLKCMDLRYPSPEDFYQTHVYKNGDIVLKRGTEADVHALCLSLGLKAADTRATRKDADTLRANGYLVEVIAQERSEAFCEARNAYNAENARREAEFKAALFAREDLSDNPKNELCYSKAYERGHSAGLAEVANIFIDLAELIR